MISQDIQTDASKKKKKRRGKSSNFWKVTLHYFCSAGLNAIYMKCCESYYSGG